jgi:hypothetical protein
MTAHGLLVTADVQDRRLIRGSWYHGPCFGVRWPLDALDEADQSTEVVALNAEVCKHYEGWQNSVAAVPDLPLIRRYLRACDTRGIGTRVLLVSSEPADGVEQLTFPAMSSADVANLTGFTQDLGFDYCAPYFDCSIVEMDINDGRFPELSAFKSRVNQHGMFATVSDLSEFIRARRALQAKSGEPLEDDDGFAIFRVQEVSKAEMIGPA